MIEREIVGAIVASAMSAGGMYVLISLRDGKLLINSLTVRLTGALPFPLRRSESLKSTEELHRVQTRGSKTALPYVGERNAHMTGCERFIKAVYTPNKVLLPDNNGSKISRGGETWPRSDGG